MNFIETFLVSEYKKANATNEKTITAMHSGNLGDIIYALPTCYLLNVNHIVLNIFEDPLSRGRELREKAAKALAPLLLAQKNITKVSIIKTQAAWEFADLKKYGIDYNLDAFRSNILVPTVHLVHQHGLFFNLSIDATASWVTVPEDTSFVPPTGKYIAIGLTSRYRRFDSDYYEALFKNVPPEQLYFIGTETDQAARCNLHGNIFKANSFVELATFIKHASLFIGNPSFPYALAEALKVPRFVEIPPNLNVYPLDSSGKILHLLTDNYVKAEIYNYLELNDHAIKLAYDSDVALQQMNHNMQLLQQKLALLQNSKIVRPAIYLLKITMLIKIICRKSLTLLKILKSKFKNMLGMIKRPLT